MTEVDFIIVGQGLAGSTLSYQLAKLGKKIAVFDTQRETSSSWVAAGLFNPITGRKMAKTWRADDLFPFLMQYYSEIEKNCGERLLNKMGIYRPFVSIEEQNEWEARTADEAYEKYIERVSQKSEFVPIKDGFGGIHLKQSGFLDVQNYLEAMANILKNKGVIYKTELFETPLMNLDSGHVKYKDIEAKRVIFCDGRASMENPYFKWLPFKLVKGEILHVESKMTLNKIINRGVFVIPQTENHFRVGATYDNFDLTLSTTPKGRLQIEAKLKELIDVEYAVKGQYAGIRPATRDRKPFIGIHPKYKSVGIFNGLGAKGVSLAPYFADQFAQHLVNQSALDKEVDISRYFSFYNDNVSVTQYE
ncbi:MAG TPA: FAD-dependent oxidoreductase [Fulvivirga sp.]|nr:FAD-dependent oxidoreductase [Fulvivirga sp.]